MAGTRTHQPTDHTLSAPDSSSLGPEQGINALLSCSDSSKRFSPGALDSPIETGSVCYNAKFVDNF
jgi:hypothetical protein